MVHNGDPDHPDRIMDVTCDLSPIFIVSIRIIMKNAKIVFGWFHVMQLVSRAFVEGRRQGAKTNQVLKTLDIYG